MEWTSITDLQGTMDEITDFDVEGGDQWKLVGLLNNFDLQMDTVSDVVRLDDFSPSTYSVVEIFDGATWRPVVKLDNVNGRTAQSLWESGNLLL